MPGWTELESEAPELAARVREILRARRHHTLATLRKDGSPRVSGIEVELRDGEVVLGMMPGSLKLADVRRDPRLAIHALSDDPPEADQAAWRGDAKLSGRAVPLPPRPEDQPEGPRFRLDLEEVVLTRLDDAATQLLIESWHPVRGLEVRRRA